MAKFERQLPDALELIARSLKAGHAFTGGMKIVADETGRAGRLRVRESS